MDTSGRGSRIAADGLSRRTLLGGAAALPIGQALLGSRPIAAAQAEGSTLVVALSASPVDIDPHGANEYRSALTVRGAYEQLIGLVGDSTDEYEGLVAESWSANEDQSVWTFMIRPGVTFHDGSPVDAEAVRLSFERLFTLGLGPGFEMSRFIEDPGQITAPDAATVVFDLGRPQPLFEAGISSQYGGQIVNARLAREREIDGDWGRADAQLVEDGLGSGPYRIVEFLPEEQVIFERFEEYWRGREGNHFERIVIRIVPENEARVQVLEQGVADIVDNLTPGALDALANNPDVALDLSYSNEVDYFILTVDGALASPEARRALCYAFPYDEVIEGVYRGYGKRAIGPVAEVTRGFAPGTFTYETDLIEAKRLLDEAGVAEGTTLELAAQTGDANIDSAIQLFQANLAEIGIALDVSLMDAGTFASIIFRDVEPEEQPEMMAWYWWPAYNDAWNHLQLQVLCSAQGSAGTNAGYYCNPTVDELMTQARDASGAAYDDTLAEIQQILSRDDPPAIYFMQRQWPTALRADVSGFAFNPVYIGTYDFWRLGRG